MSDAVTTPPSSSLFVTADSLRVRLDWFNKLRWVAAAVAAVAVLVVDLLAVHPLPLRSLLGMTGVLLVLNLLYVLRNRRVPPASIGAEILVVKLQMAGDLVVLTVLLHLTGGVENPLLFVYVVHVIIAALLFKGREIFTIAALAIFLFTAAVMGEYFGLLPHHHLLSASEMTHELPYILVTLASFWLVLLSSAWMGASIMKHNRAIRNDLVDRQRELVRADEAKMDFFRYVTHEVKSPVSTAQSAVETARELGGAAMSATVADLLDRAVARLGQANEIVRDLADLTSGGLGRSGALQTLDLSELTTAVVRQHKELAERRDQEIDVVMPDLPVVVTSSRSMVEKILTNLVGNAVRYNRDGGRVTVRLEDLDESVRLEVQDEGIGIEPGDRERIFEEFFRSPAAQQMTNLGTGLGLPIVKRFIADLGGRIQVTSTPGEGASFRVELPRSRRALRSPAGREAATTGVEGQS